MRDAVVAPFPVRRRHEPRRDAANVLVVARERRCMGLHVEAAVSGGASSMRRRSDMGRYRNGPIESSAAAR